MDKNPNWYTSLSTQNEENPPLEALIFACQKSEIINPSLALQVIMTAFIQREIGVQYVRTLFLESILPVC